MINKSGKLVKIISVILISIIAIIGQPAYTDIGIDDGFISSTYDSLIFLNIPDRSENAIEGSEFVNKVTGLSLADREKAAIREILSGNIPSFSRKLKQLKVIETVNGESYEIVFYTTMDYIAIGSDQDYLYIPMTPATGQYLADKMNCILPTKKVVDIIYSKSEIKLRPQPIPPSDIMTTVPVFWQHTDSIKQQIFQMKLDRSANNVIAGHKKDIIISNKIYNKEGTSDRVVIYGWHLGVNNPIQPVYNGHVDWYADYSHGLRLISKTAFINGESIQVEDILKDSTLSILLSGEGLISKPYYPGK